MGTTSAERMRRLRERRAAAIEPAPDARLRDADELLAPAVEQALAALDLGDRDAAAAQLARRYAAAIDDAAGSAAALRAVGPLLGKALEALQATPASRKPPGKQPMRREANPVRELRASHAKFMGRR